RPSFGRKAGSRLGTRVSQFGEFDGIVGTHQAVHLIETKWSRSVEVFRKPTLELRKEQIRRHEIFRWLLARWRALRAESWDAFRHAACADFEAAFPGFTIAHADSGVALNLSFVLRQLVECGEAIRDVLLYTTIDEDHRECPPFAQPNSFHQVRLWFSGADRSGFYIFGAPEHSGGTTGGAIPPARV
ncbi:MAG: hypothetical protein ACJ8J0_04620, partial [Longimicrobiaceae bacterium]